MSSTPDPGRPPAGRAGSRSGAGRPRRPEPASAASGDADAGWPQGRAGFGDESGAEGSGRPGRDRERRLAEERWGGEGQWAAERDAGRPAGDRRDDAGRAWDEAGPEDPRGGDWAWTRDERGGGRADGGDWAWPGGGGDGRPGAAGTAAAGTGGAEQGDSGPMRSGRAGSGPVGSGPAGPGRAASGSVGSGSVGSGAAGAERGEAGPGGASVGGAGADGAVDGASGGQSGPELARAVLDAALARRREAQSRQPRRRAGTGADGKRLRGYSGPGPDPRDPQPFGVMIERLMKARGWEKPKAEATVFGAWERVVGPDIAQHSRPVKLDAGVLTVEAESTAWATQLRLLAAGLLKNIASEVGHNVVTKLTIHGPAAPSWSRGPRRVQGRGPRDTYG